MSDSGRCELYGWCWFVLCVLSAALNSLAGWSVSNVSIAACLVLSGVHFCTAMVLRRIDRHHPAPKGEQLTGE